MIKSFKRAIFSVQGRFLEMVYGEHLPTRHGRFYAPKQWIHPHARARIYWNRYERQEFSLVKRWLLDDVTTVELGTGVGVISSAIFERLKDPGKYVGVEANPDLAIVARTNAKRFSGLHTEIIHGAILGSTETIQTVAFHFSTENFHISTIASNGTSLVGETQVPAFTLSNILSRNSIEDFQLVADIEGAEWQLLQKDAKALKNCRRVIIELHDCSFESEIVKIGDSVDRFLKIGFKQVDQLGRTFVFEQ